MLVRLAYSIAIQIPFDVLLLDEVLAVGDEAFQEKCFASEWERRSSLVTHELDILDEFAESGRLSHELARS